MKKLSLPISLCKTYRRTLNAAACVAALGFAVSQAISQEHPTITSAPFPSIVAKAASPVEGSNLAPAAYIHYLLALRFATDGIKHEALREAAASLRVQREGNPTAALAFQLLVEQRQNIHIRLCCVTANFVGARYSADGASILAALDDNTVSVWDAHTGKQTAGPMHHDHDVLAVAWSLDGRRLVTSSNDATIRLWDAGNGQLLHPPFHAVKPLAHVALSPNGERVLGSEGGEVYLLDAMTGKVLSPKIKYHDDVNVVALSNDGKYALVGTDDDFAEILDPMTGKRLHRLAHGNAIFSATFSPDSRFVLTSSGDHTAKIWDVSTGAQHGGDFTQAAPISDAEFSPDGMQILTMSHDHTARVWDAHTGRALSPLLQHSAALIDGGFSADASFAFTRGRDQSMRVWSASTGEAMMLPIHYNSNKNSAEFSPTDPSLLITDGNSAEILDLPPSDIAPVWLADLAEFTASRSRFSQSAPHDLSKIEKLRVDLLASQLDDLWTRFGRWYFSAPNQRTVSPWSKLSLQQYIDQLLVLNTKESLSYARQIAFEHPAWMLKIDAAQKAISTKTSHPETTGGTMQ
ncbi:WD40 repeat domain-containing protein [Granulicella sp. dw_53]|uniref:WD40 repeat domain-containing protein n=1 Tax=Granulicella sp. dw_53 TaxID=2719792 RepID=UPI001BD6B1BD|nr:WD40 repeat domain-containing protein [Granulicella sp. dw_53]